MTRPLTQLPLSRRHARPSPVTSHRPAPPRRHAARAACREAIGRPAARSHRTPRDPLRLPRGGGAARARPGLSRPFPARPGAPAGAAPPRPAMPPKKQQQPAGGSKKADQKKKEKIIEVRRPRPPLSRRGLSLGPAAPCCFPAGAAEGRITEPKPLCSRGGTGFAALLGPGFRCSAGILPGPSCVGADRGLTALLCCRFSSPFLVFILVLCVSVYSRTPARWGVGLCFWGQHQMIPRDPFTP